MPASFVFVVVAVAAAATTTAGSISIRKIKIVAEAMNVKSGSGQPGQPASQSVSASVIQSVSHSVIQQARATLEKKRQLKGRHYVEESSLGPTIFSLLRFTWGFVWETLGPHVALIVNVFVAESTSVSAFSTALS